MPAKAFDWARGLRQPARDLPAVAAADASRRRPRFRHEVEHPALPGAGRLQGDGGARHGHGRRRAGAASRTASSSPTAPATRSRSATPSKRSRGWPARSRSSASAWAISCCGLALGAKTFKLKFGHRGANQPVLNQRTEQGRDHHAEPRLRGAHRRLCRPTWSRRTSTSTTARSKACATSATRCSACSTIPRRRPGRTTAAICSRNFAS